MKPDFPNDLVELIKNKVVTLEFIKGWAERTYNKGKLNNLDYVEILAALRGYERT